MFPKLVGIPYHVPKIHIITNEEPKIRMKWAAIDSSTIVLKFVNLIIPNSDYGYAKVNQRQILEKDVYVKNHQRYEIHPKKQI